MPLNLESRKKIEEERVSPTGTEAGIKLKQQLCSELLENAGLKPTDRQRSSAAQRTLG